MQSVLKRLAVNESEISTLKEMRKVTLATQTIGCPSWYLPQVGFFVLDCYSTNIIWKTTVWQNLIHQTNTSAYLLFAKNAMGKIEKTYCRGFWITQVSLQLKLRKRKISSVLQICCPPWKWLCRAILGVFIFVDCVAGRDFWVGLAALSLG